MEGEHSTNATPPWKRCKIGDNLSHNKSCIPAFNIVTEIGDLE